MRDDAGSPNQTPTGIGRAELVATIVLSIATVLTAWSAFQANKWGGEMSIQFSNAGAARTSSVQEANLAASQTTIDVTLFTEYAAAVSAGDEQLASFLEDRFRPEFLPAFEAWLATEPLTAADAPASPFEMDEYRLAATEQAASLVARADEAAVAAREANARGDAYVLLTVLFASVLFFAGVSTKASHRLAQFALTGLAALLATAGAALLLTFPVLI